MKLRCPGNEEDHPAWRPETSARAADPAMAIARFPVVSGAHEGGSPVVPGFLEQSLQ